MTPVPSAATTMPIAANAAPADRATEFRAVISLSSRAWARYFFSRGMNFVTPWIGPTSPA